MDSSWRKYVINLCSKQDRHSCLWKVSEAIIRLENVINALHRGRYNTRLNHNIFGVLIRGGSGDFSTPDAAQDTIWTPSILTQLFISRNGNFYLITSPLVSLTFVLTFPWKDNQQSRRVYFTDRKQSQINHCVYHIYQGSEDTSLLVCFSNQILPPSKS